MEQTLINSISQLAIDAGNKILSVYKTNDFDIKTKTDGSLVTEADHAAHRTILEGLLKLDGSSPVLSEESTASNAEERTSWKRYWLVDPLDGTAEFVDKNGEFTFSHAIANDLKTEGEEVLEINLFSDVYRLINIANYSSVRINDSSTFSLVPLEY